MGNGHILLKESAEGKTPLLERQEQNWQRSSPDSGYPESKEGRRDESGQ